MQQVLVIHGGNAFNTYEEYLTSLREKHVTLETRRDWKHHLGERLGAEYQVIFPTMPCKQNAKYSEWVICSKSICRFLRDGVILVGHSLGGIFLAKYLSENTMPVKIRSTILVAAPHNTPTEHPLADFVLTSPLTKFIEQAGSVIMYHSADDTIVPYSNAESYMKDLRNAELRTFEGRGHFNDEMFPEIEDAIREISL